MADNVAINLVIGLVFIYLLYSLLATVLGEMISTNLGIRALNLKEAVNRMLVDGESQNFRSRLKDSFNILKNPNNGIINKFYDNPEIKYLGSSGIFKSPSTFKASSFSRTILYELNGSGSLSAGKIHEELVKLSRNTETILAKCTNENLEYPTMAPESARFVLSLFHDSHGDLRKFRIYLEAWFDHTMEQSIEWYKRKIQVILFMLGFLMAWIFNAGTFTIIEKLSLDRDAREKLANMASAYLQNKDNSIDTENSATQEQSIDTLMSIKKRLEIDIQEANNILGIGSWLPDSVLIKYDLKTQVRSYSPYIDEKLLPSMYLDKKFNNAQVCFDFPTKMCAFILLIFKHFWGYFITAIAISLGAPFWFDLLNKVMQLRTSQKLPTDSTENTDSVSPLRRIG